MTDDLILADAIYAAGQALHVDACTEGDPHDGCDCGDWDREAEIAVRAALPSIEHQLRELIAQAIEALPNLSVSHFGTRPLPDLIRKDTAARIARGDASNGMGRSWDALTTHEPIEGTACPVCWLRHPEGECDRD